MSTAPNIKLTREERLDYMVALSGCGLMRGQSPSDAVMFAGITLAEIEKAMAKEEEDGDLE